MTEPVIDDYQDDCLACCGGYLLGWIAGALFVIAIIWCSLWLAGR